MTSGNPDNPEKWHRVTKENKCIKSSHFFYISMVGTNSPVRGAESMLKRKNMMSGGGQTREEGKITRRREKTAANNTQNHCQNISRERKNSLPGACTMPH